MDAKTLHKCHVYLSSSCTPVPETLPPPHLNQPFNSSFFNCSGFRPFKDAPGTSSSVKIVGKDLFFDLLTSLNASFAAIVFESPGSVQGVWLQIPACSARIASSFKCAIIKHESGYGTVPAVCSFYFHWASGLSVTGAIVGGWGLVARLRVGRPVGVLPPWGVIAVAAPRPMGTQPPLATQALIYENYVLLIS